jgi:branched-chain amino acid transport system substrate-binding protein
LTTGKRACRSSRRAFCLAVLEIDIAPVSATPAGITIGVQAPLTGPAATDGVSAKVAAELAVSDVNAKGGVLGQKLVLDIQGDQAKTDQAKTDLAIFTANKLVGQDSVKFAVSGSYSASGRAAAPDFQAAKVPFISAYGVHPDITRAGDYCFRAVHLGQPRGRAAAKFIGETLG